MATSSTIEWTQTTWNPVVGCTKVSEGCRHCYAERMAGRLAAMAREMERSRQHPGRKANYKSVTSSRGWTGKVITDQSALDDPFRWRRPRVVFVNSMSDLFHAAVPEAFIRRVFEVMRDCPQHTFQVLTKRPERALELAPRLQWSSNIWFGTSVEDDNAKHRIDLLRAIPARVRFLSAEPLLGSLGDLQLADVHWVIVGGESGPGARPMQSDWAREIQRQCTAQSVAFFFKQWGGVNKKRTGRVLDGRIWNQMPAGVRV